MKFLVLLKYFKYIYLLELLYIFKKNMYVYTIYKFWKKYIILCYINKLFFIFRYVLNCTLLSYPCKFNIHIYPFVGDIVAFLCIYDIILVLKYWYLIYFNRNIGHKRAHQPVLFLTVDYIDLVFINSNTCLINILVS